MENSSIEWTDHTFNPWIGCTKVSDGCKHCYAETLMDKRYGRVKWGPEGARIRTGVAYWKRPLTWNRQAAAEGVRRKVFCASLADVFEHKRDQPEMSEWREELFELIDQTLNLDWLLLTKRPENIFRSMPERWLWHGLPRNIWIGVSAENQAVLDERWTILDSETHYLHPSVLFLSLEPLLGRIDLSDVLDEIDTGDEEHTWWTRRPDWVIVGGESGPGARPMNLNWAGWIMAQCMTAEVPFFMKQINKIAAIPDYLMVREFPETTLEVLG